MIKVDCFECYSNVTTTMSQMASSPTKNLKNYIFAKFVINDIDGNDMKPSLEHMQSGESKECNFTLTVVDSSNSNVIEF